MVDDIYRFSVRIAGIDTPEIKSKAADLRAKAIRSRNRVLQLIGMNIGLDDVLSKKDIETMLEGATVGRSAVYGLGQVRPSHG